jgi:putative hydrolase of the HAD superfamily
MKGKKYTHIFFDLDNTLWDFDRNSFHALHIAFSHFSLDVQGCEYGHFFEVYSKHNQKLWEEYRQKKVVKNELKKLRFQKTFADLKINSIDPEEFDEFYLAEMPRQKHLFEGAIELLNYLKLKGYKLYIITNGFREVQQKKLEMTGLKRFFTKVYISEDVKAPKPSGKIFEFALKSSNASKKGSLMIGDDPETDVAGALNFGIDAVYLMRNVNSVNRSNLEWIKKRNQVYLINNLNELKNIV